LDAVQAVAVDSLGSLFLADSFSDRVRHVLLLPVVSLSSSSLSFGSQTLGIASPPQSLTLTNTGFAGLSISSITASGDFSQTNTCGNNLRTQASCSINVTFTPTGTGTRSGAITVTDNALDSPEVISLTGTGSLPLVAPTSLNFGTV